MIDNFLNMFSFGQKVKDIKGNEWLQIEEFDCDQGNFALVAKIGSKFPSRVFLIRKENIELSKEIDELHNLINKK